MNQADEALVYKAGLRILSPPDAPESTPHEVITTGYDKEGEHPKESFDRPLGGIMPEPKDLDDEEDDFGLPLNILLMTNESRLGYYPHQLHF